MGRLQGIPLHGTPCSPWMDRDGYRRDRLVMIPLTPTGRPHRQRAAPLSATGWGLGVGGSSDADVLLWLALVLIGVFSIIALVAPRFEAAAYRRVTGKQGGYWDAVWLDLRVQDGVQ